MRNIKLTIEYDGTDFKGWQKQGDRVSGCQSVRASKCQRVKESKCQRTKKRFRTVQEEIEKAGQKLFGKDIHLIGAGRTDAGVHAEGQVANFRVGSLLPLANIVRGFNSYLDRDIAVLSAEDVYPDFHARFDAKEKLYRYRILNRDVRSPLLIRYSAFVIFNLDINKMKKSAEYLVGKRDFASFRTGAKKDRDSVRTIKRLDIVSSGSLLYGDSIISSVSSFCGLTAESKRNIFLDPAVKPQDDSPPRANLIEIYIQADGFLYNMARNIAGILIDVGRGKIYPEAVQEILSKKHRESSYNTAPSKGLCLMEVSYGDSIIPSESSSCGSCPGFNPGAESR